MIQRVETVEDLRKLPVGSVIESSADCLWSGRYAGIRWRKQDPLTLVCMSSKDNFGFRKDNTVAYLPAFLDPLPAELVSNE